jgi:acetylglutamate kinase
MSMFELGTSAASADAAVAANVDVIKVGGRAQEEVSLPSLLAARWRAAPGSFCVVHGGAVEIDRLQRRLGGTPTFVGGRRVTTDEDIDTVRMALSGSANKRLVAALCALGVPAVGISGEDAGLLQAEPTRNAALGRVGTPVGVRQELIRALLGAGFLPVIAPLGASTAEGGGALNVNGDDAAAAIAAALGSGEMLFVTDVSGVRRGSSVLPSLGADEALAMIASGEASGGMLVKIEGALGALDRGVSRVRIGDVAAISNATVGTTLFLREE